MRTYPIRSIAISRNTIATNGGAGVLLALSTNDGLPVVADQITVTQNLISANAKSYGPFLRGGICIQGGQANGLGQLTVTANKIVDNGGYGFASTRSTVHDAAHARSQRLRPERARRQRMVTLRRTSWWREVWRAQASSTPSS